MSDELKVKPSRHTRRQRIVRKVRRAARDENYSDVLKYYLDLCLLEIEGNNTLADKMTPRTVIEIIEARIALRKLEAYEATLKIEGDVTADDFRRRLDTITKNKMDDVKLKLVKKG